MQVAGLNHFIFVRQILYKGKEWLPEVSRRHQRRSGSAGAAQHSAVPLAVASAAGLRHDPCAYLRYYYMKDDLLRQELAEAGGEGTRGKWLSSWKKSCLTSTATRTWRLSRRRWRAVAVSNYSEAARELMNAIYNDKRIIMQRQHAQQRRHQWPAG